MPASVGTAVSDGAEGNAAVPPAAAAPVAAAPADAGQQRVQVSALTSAQAAPQPPAMAPPWLGSETQDNLPPPAPGRVLVSSAAAEAPPLPHGRPSSQQRPRLPPLVPMGLGSDTPSGLSPPSQQGPVLCTPASQVCSSCWCGT